MGANRETIAGYLERERASYAEFTADMPTSGEDRDAQWLTERATHHRAVVGALAVKAGVGQEVEAAQGEASARAPVTMRLAVEHPGGDEPRIISVSPRDLALTVVDRMTPARAILLRVAAAIDGADLRDEVARLLDEAPPPAVHAPTPELLHAGDAALDAQEAALLMCADRLDEIAAR